jgi:hypothetical protein
MATQAIYQERRGELNQLVRGWDRRLRLQQLFTWLPRCLLPGLAIGIVIALISRLRPWLVSGQILLATGILLVLGLVAMLAVVWVWPRPGLVAARRFDRLFGLQERVSTALELIDGRIHADEELLSLQIDDAWKMASAVRPAESLPLTWRWREWGGILVLAVILIVLLVIPNPQEAKIAQDTAQRAAIDAAADQLRQITEDVAADASLEPEDREQLLQTLQTSTNVLQQENVTPEEAFASLSDAQGALQEKADDLNQQANAGQSGLQAASDALKNFQSPDQQPQNGSEGVSSALNNMMEDIPTMTQQQQQEAANSLEQAAQALQESNPDASQAMQQASNSLQGQNGDTSAAQQSLGQASDSIQQAQQQQQSQQASAQQMSQSAQDLQNSANQVSQPSQQNQQQSQNGQDSQNGQQGNQGQNGQQNQQNQQNSQNSQQPNQNQSNQQPQQGQNNQQNQNNQQGQPGQQGQQGQPQQGQPNQSGQEQGQPGQQGQDGQGQQGQSGNQSGDQGQQPGQTGQSGQSNQQGQPGQNGQQAGSSSAQPQGSPNGQTGSAAGAGAGDGAGDQGQDSQSGVPSQGGQIPQDNNPDGQGQGQYDPIYAPQRIGGQSDQQVQLNGDASSSPVKEGEFSQNPDGNVSVPYDQVFSDYSNAANRALESDYIPLGLRDVVRDYFSSLEPGQGSGNTNNPNRGTTP